MTYDIASLRSLKERVEKATGADREIDAEVCAALRIVPDFDDTVYVAPLHYEIISDFSGPKIRIYTVWADGEKHHAATRNPPPITGSLDACVALADRVLPGWWYSIGTCCVSDDACIAPDFNSPDHGERLRREIGEFGAESEWDAAFDVDRRPPGNLPLALIEAILRALIALGERGALIAKEEGL
jgi:hypothetical protein